MSKISSYFLADASVLIDYVQADQSILALAAKHLGPIMVPDLILAEVEDLDADDLVELGLTLHETSMTLLTEVAAQPRSRLSVPDRMCLRLSKDQGWTCLTNDGGLYRACEGAGVLVWRGLRIMIELNRSGHLGRKSACTVAEAIHAQNPLYVTKAVIDSFRKQLHG